MKGFALGNYYQADSMIHRIDPRIKLISSLLLMIFLFMISQPLPLLFYGLFLLVLILLSQVPVKLVLRTLKPVVILALFALMINAFTGEGEIIYTLGPLQLRREGLWLGIRMAIRLFYLILSTQLCLTLTTTPLQIADGLESLLKPLQRIGFPSHELAMMMSIALRFVPTLADETDRIMKAQSSRGADYDTGGTLARARGLVSVLVPLFVSAFKRADDLALAMEARCYHGGEGRTKLHVLQYKAADWIALLLVILVCATLIILERWV